ncbi:uncharacterized protein BDZ99DRAFT_514738 [Mytilinidion resinicola]|uniref:Uncharacterized protein n=1 Tax=Mytilinidion resinicola TaxID=574789 RepID=A0A6A6Z530_9PEZI|nr:uncharacterized protein BDZ99DRAFT_514738 [Mytilinidion resinicola]KAF2816130.1 hypothetical protein BDZ99DRAFT_514738 [Mytilinidion resinicola]
MSSATINTSGFTTVVSKKTAKTQKAMEKKKYSEETKNVNIVGNFKIVDKTGDGSKKTKKAKKAKKFNVATSDKPEETPTASVSRKKDVMGRIDRFVEEMKKKEGPHAFNEQEEADIRAAMSASMEEIDDKGKEKKEESAPMNFAKAVASKQVQATQSTLSAELPNVRIITKLAKPMGTGSNPGSSSGSAGAAANQVKPVSQVPNKSAMKVQSTVSAPAPTIVRQESRVDPEVQLKDSIVSSAEPAVKKVVVDEKPQEEAVLSKEEKKRLKRKAQQLRQRQAKEAAASEKNALEQAIKEAAVAEKKVEEDEVAKKKAGHNPELHKKLKELIKAKEPRKNQALASAGPRKGYSNGATVAPGTIALTKKEK